MEAVQDQAQREVGSTRGLRLMGRVSWSGIDAKTRSSFALRLHCIFARPSNSPIRRYITLSSPPPSSPHVRPPSQPRRTRRALLSISQTALLLPLSYGRGPQFTINIITIISQTSAALFRPSTKINARRHDRLSTQRSPTPPPNLHPLFPSSINTLPPLHG